MIFDKVSKCPVCGKRPKIKKSFFGRTTIQCKPLFGKPHMVIQVGACDSLMPKKKAIKSWNNAVEDINAKERRFVNVGISRFKV